jgi:cytoskeletal protein CcmA (bactofilin family)
VYLRSARDPVDRLYQTPAQIVRRLLGAPLYHCYVCRLQFYDIGAGVPPKGPGDAQALSKENVAPEPPEMIDDAIISGGTTVGGEGSAVRDISLNGEIEGPLEIPGQRLILGRTGRIRGDVRADEVVVMGTLQGNVEARLKVVIRASATLIGDIRAASLSVEEGACVKGKMETL